MCGAETEESELEESPGRDSKQKGKWKEEVKFLGTATQLFRHMVTNTFN